MFNDIWRCVLTRVEIQALIPGLDTGSVTLLTVLMIALSLSFTFYFFASKSFWHPFNCHFFSLANGHAGDWVHKLHCNSQLASWVPLFSLVACLVTSPFSKIDGTDLLAKEQYKWSRELLPLNYLLRVGGRAFHAFHAGREHKIGYIFNFHLAML